MVARAQIQIQDAHLFKKAWPAAAWESNAPFVKIE